MSGYRLPTNQSYKDTFRFLTWEQFPAVMEAGIEHFAVLPQTGVYRHVNPSIKDFKKTLLSQTGRQFTLSGVGSFIDYDTFGHQIKRPTPQLQGSGCGGNSLCLEPTCFGFTEGVSESNNVLQDICWSLSMPCLKDQYYSDASFDDKMKQYFAMFFAQAPAVLQAYQRTRLIRESIKVVATSQSYTMSGSLFGPGIPLPFYIDPVDAISFPNLTNIPVGGFNIKAFADFVAPRLFSGSWGKGMEGLTVYGLNSDLQTAKEQTASVMDHYLDLSILNTLRAVGMSSSNKLDAMLNGFIHDGMFPTFKTDGSGNVEIIPQEILEPATIAGLVQTDNPEHCMSKLRGLLFVPDNWMFDLVEPPKDDFSDLGLGKGLDFRTTSPNSFPILSSSLFAANKIGPDGVVYLGQKVDSNGRVVTGASGIVPRETQIREAVRTQLLTTYSSVTCSGDAAMKNVGPAAVPQGMADGFMLKSLMYIATAVKGTARPVLVLFQIDEPRSAKPIVVCSPTNITVNATVGNNTIVNCCPGNQIYTVLTFRDAVGSAYAVNDVVAYRTGPLGQTFLAVVTSVSGNTVVIQSQDNLTLLPCCSGAKDDYGVQAELVKITGATATSSEIMKARYDTGTSSLYLEFFDALAARAINTAATITLDSGSVINVTLAAAASGVSARVVTAVGETCSLADLDCACLMNAVFSY
jgi:hypothetical protein